MHFFVNPDHAYCLCGTAGDLQKCNAAFGYAAGSRPALNEGSEDEVRRMVILRFTILSYSGYTNRL